MTIEEKIYSLLVPAVIARLSEVTAVQASATPYSTFFCIAQEPLATHEEALIQSLRCWEFQFSSFASSPLLARAETKKIVDYLTSAPGNGISVCFLKARHMGPWDDTTKMAHSIAEVIVWETLG